MYIFPCRYSPLFCFTERLNSRVESYSIGNSDKVRSVVDCSGDFSLFLFFLCVIFIYYDDIFIDLISVDQKEVISDHVGRNIKSEILRNQSHYEAVCHATSKS